MKTKIFIMLSLVLFTLSSCEKNKVEGVIEEEPYWRDTSDDDPFGLMEDGGYINRLNIKMSHHNDAYDPHNANSPFNDYLTMTLEYNFFRESYQSKLMEKEGLNFRGWYSFIDSTYVYFKTKTKPLQDAHKKSIKEGIHYPWIKFYTAYINGEVQITCDKTLFGKEKGENLAQFFDVVSDQLYMPHGIENPTLTYMLDKDVPKTVDKLLTKETWLEPSCIIKFDSIPEEKYNELTFRITIPIKMEHTYEYVMDKFKGREAELKTSEKTFYAEYKARFK